MEGIIIIPKNLNKYALRSKPASRILRTLSHKGKEEFNIETSAAIRCLDVAGILKVQRVQIFPGIAVKAALLVIRTLSSNISHTDWMTIFHAGFKMEFCTFGKLNTVISIV